MAIRISTGAADHIREVCTHNGELDLAQQAEMRAESQEYRDEVMGRHDEEFDPYDCDDYDAREDERDADDQDERARMEDEGHEDMGWDGGMED